MIRKIIALFIILPTCIIFFSQQSIADNVPAPETASSEHIQYWIKTLETHPLVLIRKQAARQLGNLQSSTAVPSLIKGLSDVNEDVRMQCAYSLGRLGDTSALRPLYELIETNSNTQVKSAARSAIDKINAHEEFQRQKKKKFQDFEEKSPTSF